MGERLFEKAKIIAELSQARSGAPWVRKLGYLCIQEILVLRKSSVRTSTPSCKILHFKFPRVSAHSHPDNNKADSFFRLNFNVYIDVDNRRKELEREIKNKGDQFRWNNKMKIL